MKRTYKLRKQKKRFDFILLAVCILLSLFGLLMVFEASSVTALRKFNDQYYFFKNQAVWLGIGLLAMVIGLLIDYKKYYSISVVLLIGLLGSLVMVFLPGIGIKVSGAYRWINLGFFQFQPTELAKLVLVIYLAAWFTYKEKNRLFSFLILLGLVLGLIILEPDLGTAAIIGAIATVLYFLSGAPLWHFSLLIPSGIAGILILAVISPYRYQRLKTFINPSQDPLGSSYHIKQLLLALGSGGFLGIGIGKSMQKYSYLPEASTDSIFAIVGEELGFIGASAVIFLFMFLIYRGGKIAKNAPSRFGQLLAAGLVSWFALQTIINLGAAVALLPLTGVPLLFLSYGGSSLIVTFYAVGILLNISKQS